MQLPLPHESDIQKSAVDNPAERKGKRKALVSFTPVPFVSVSVSVSIPVPAEIVVRSARSSNCPDDCRVTVL